MENTKEWEKKMENTKEWERAVRQSPLIFANQRIAQLEKELEQQKTYTEMYRKESNQRKDEINEIHDFLDGLPNVMPRDKNNYNEYKISTRLLSWIAAKASL